MKGTGDPQAIAAKRAQRKRKYLQYSKTTKNYTLAVSRLPDDVLEDIFFRCGPHPVDLLRSWNARRGVRGDENISCFVYEKPWMAYGNLIRFSHVCQRWRKIIRTTGAFWSYRTVCARSNMPSSLVHSLVRDASFVIDLILASGEVLLGLQPWVRDPATIARTGTLQAVISPSRWKHFSDLIKASPAPALKSLTVANTRNGPYNDQDIGLGHVGDAKLFADTVPLLRRVCLISVKVPSDSTILQNLTVLSLCNSDVIGYVKRVEDTRMGHILDVVSRCPRLERLVLDNTLPYVTQCTNSQRIVLSSLSHVSIVGAFRQYRCDGRAGLCFLSYLDLPSLSNLHLGHTPPVAMSVDELVPKNMHISVGDANALSIKLYENDASRNIESVEIEFGVVSEECLTSSDELPSHHFSTMSSVTYTIDHNDAYFASSNFAATMHSFVQRCTGNRRNSISALILEMETRLSSRYRRHSSLRLQKLFDLLSELVVIEVRSKCTSPAPSYTEHREGSHGSKTPAVLSDLETDDGKCTIEVQVWALGAEVADALHDAVVQAEKEPESAVVNEGDGVDVDVDSHSSNKGKAGTVILPRLARLSFLGTYFNTSENHVELNKKKSWRAGPAFEHLLAYVEHRARHSDGVAEGTGVKEEASSSISSSPTAFTFTIPSPSSSSSTRTSARLEEDAPPPLAGGSIPSLRFSGCFGIRDEWYEKLSSRCGARSISPHALHSSRLHAGALDWDMRDPWFVPNSTPMDDEDDERRKSKEATSEDEVVDVPQEGEGEGEGMNNSTDNPPATTELGTDAAAGGSIPKAETQRFNDEQDVSYGIQALDLASAS